MPSEDVVCERRIDRARVITEIKAGSETGMTTMRGGEKRMGLVGMEEAG